MPKKVLCFCQPKDIYRTQTTAWPEWSVISETGKTDHIIVVPQYSLN